LVKFDLLKIWPNIKNVFHCRSVSPKYNKLHFGCGSVKVQGWLNVDILKSDFDVDLTNLPLPWKSGSFEVIVSQQTIEHLGLHNELIPLLEEMNRVAKKSAEIWLACPDMKKVCKSYFKYKSKDLLTDRKSRWPDFSLQNDTPSQHMINILFHQSGQHKNLYDYELVKYALEKSGFKNCKRVTEKKSSIKGSITSPKEVVATHQFM